MRLLVTGARGLLGAAIVREFAAAGWEVVPLHRGALDVTDAGAVAQQVSDAHPDLVVNCVAYNDVDGAEKDPVTALQVNAMAVRSLAAAAKTAGATFVHYGTDFVFDGESDRPYVEDDRPNPRSAYGVSKLLGEWFALDHPRAYVLRVESLFGEPGPDGSRQGSLKGILVRASRRRAVAGVRGSHRVARIHDRHRRGDARAGRAARAAGRLSLRECRGDELGGHRTEAARLLGLPIDMKPITLESVALPARRPKYSALSTAKLAAAGIPMPAWQDALARHLKELTAGGRPER